MDKMDRVGDLFEITPYDGCGKCLVAMLRLSRVSDATSSPQRQAKQINAETKAVGGHIIGVADDMEVSGAVNPLNRPKFGPWLRDEMGPYSGIVAASVDRIGRNLVDVLNTCACPAASFLSKQARCAGVWNYRHAPVRGGVRRAAASLKGQRAARCGHGFQEPGRAGRQS
jgi:hypothetical protein